MKELECSQDFFQYKSMEIFQTQANSAILGSIWPNFKLVRDVIDVLVTYKYVEDPIKIGGDSVFKTFSPL